MYCGNCGKKVEDEHSFCSECGESTRSKKTKKNDIILLEKRVSALEKLGINNPNLFTRSFATYGYLIVAQLIVSGVVLLFLMFLGLFE